MALDPVRAHELRDKSFTGNGSPTGRDSSKVFDVDGQLLQRTLLGVQASASSFPGLHRRESLWDLLVCSLANLSRNSRLLTAAGSARSSMDSVVHWDGIPTGSTAWAERKASSLTRSSLVFASSSAAFRLVNSILTTSAASSYSSGFNSREKRGNALGTYLDCRMVLACVG